MTSIKMLENKGSYKAGDTAHVTSGVAELLIGSGYAEAVESTPKRGRPAKAKTDDDEGTE
jgi:hypothetical protein